MGGCRPSVCDGLRKKYTLQFGSNGFKIFFDDDDAQFVPSHFSSDCHLLSDWLAGARHKNRGAQFEIPSYCGKKKKQKRKKKKGEMETG